MLFYNGSLGIESEDLDQNWKNVISLVDFRIVASKGLIDLGDPISLRRRTSNALLRPLNRIAKKSKTQRLLTLSAVEGSW